MAELKLKTGRRRHETCWAVLAQARVSRPIRAHQVLCYIWAVLVACQWCFCSCVCFRGAVELSHSWSPCRSLPDYFVNQTRYMVSSRKLASIVFSLQWSNSAFLRLLQVIAQVLSDTLWPLSQPSLQPASPGDLRCYASARSSMSHFTSPAEPPVPSSALLYRQLLILLNNSFLRP